MGPRRTAAALAACCLLALTGCGATEGSAPDGARPSVSAAVAASVLTDAVAAARQAGSARITGSITTTEAQRTVTATLSGVQRFEPPAMDLTVGSDTFGAGTVVRQLLVDGRAYVQVPELGDRWVALDIGQFAGTLSPLLSGTDLSGLSGLQDAGTGTVEGAAVRYITAQIDLGEALRLAGLPPETVAGTTGQLAADAGSAQVTAAIDEAGRLVEWRVDSTVDLADGTTMRSTADLRFYDFGVATDISAPDPAQVLDPGALTGIPQP